MLIKADSIGKGFKWSLPILLGVTPIGITYGLLAQQTGLGVLPTMGLSLFVFAGASQFMAVSMLHTGVEALAIIAAGFIVNFRHVLMSASLASHIEPWSVHQRLMLGAMLTDESFVMHSMHFSEGDMDPTAALTLNFSMYVTWATSSLIGYYLGALIKRPEAWGLDFVLSAMFIGLLLPNCRRRSAAVAALSGGAVSVALHLTGAGNWAAFLGALTGATTGTLIMEESA